MMKINNFKKNSGFTLLELLIVVIVIGILSATALPQYQRMTRRARATEATSAIGALLNAQMFYYYLGNDFETGSMPDLDVTMDETNFTYVGVADGSDSVTITATGTAGRPTVGIVVRGTLFNNGTKRIEIPIGL